VGAHTALAKAIVESGGDHDLEVEWLRVTSSDHLEPDLMLFEPGLLGEASAFVLCFRDPISEALLAHPPPGKPVWDVCGLSDHPTVRPGPLEPVAAVVEALAPLGPQRVVLTCLESAATFDQSGIEALSEQTRAVFTLQSAGSEGLPGTLAFNVRGSVAARGEAAAAPEAELRGDLERWLPEPVWFVTRLLVPSFSSDAFVLHAELAEPTDRDHAVELLGQGRALRPVDEVLTTQEAVGRDDVRLTVAAEGRSVRIVGTYDRLRRGSASQVVWRVESWSRDPASE
jgi:hypothetical protein